MASKYAKPLAVPAEFADVLRTFTREALRLQGKLETQEAIFEFGAQYFRDLLHKRGGGAAAGASTGAGGSARTNNDAASDSPAPLYAQLGEDELRHAVTDAFEAVRGQAGDGDSPRAISFLELRRAAAQLGERLEFSPAELRALLAEADESAEGGVDLDAFVPLAADAALALRASRPQRLAREAASGGAQLLHGLTREEMEALLRERLQRLDEGETGAVPRAAFLQAVRDADLGLTRREVNMLMAEAPAADAGADRVAYHDAVPMCFPVLAEAAAAGVVALPREQDELAQLVLEAFASADAEATGVLSVAELSRQLRAADLGLTRLQIAAAMAEAQEDEGGCVRWDKFAAHAAGMLLALVRLGDEPARAAFVLQHRQSGDCYAVLGMHQHALEQALARALEAADEPQRGLLAPGELSDALEAALPELSLRQRRALLALAEPDEAGEREYALLVHSGFQVLQLLQEYDRMVTEA